MFLDYQNVYKGARETFGTEADDYTFGQIYPRRLGLLLCDRGRPIDPDRELELVRVFRGAPSSKHNPRGQAACQRQVDEWNSQARVEAVTRPLKYYLAGWTASGDQQWTAREKGIDVLIALSMLAGAINDEYDVAILMSGDSDLVPAIEQVLALGKRCEVASWSSADRKRGRITVPGHKVWCHWLDEGDYQHVSDPNDYATPRG